MIDICIGFLSELLIREQDNTLINISDHILTSNWQQAFNCDIVGHVRHFKTITMYYYLIERPHSFWRCVNCYDGFAWIWWLRQLSITCWDTVMLQWLINVSIRTVKVQGHRNDVSAAPVVFSWRLEIRGLLFEEKNFRLILIDQIIEDVQKSAYRLMASSFFLISYHWRT